MVRTILSSALALSLAFNLSACSSSDDGASGSAPVVSAFTLDPTEVEANKGATLDGTVTFEDADGDLASTEGEIRSGGKKAGTIPAQSLSSFKGKTEAEMPFKLTMPGLPAGEYEIVVWAVDAAGHTSEEKAVTLTAK